MLRNARSSTRMARGSLLGTLVTTLLALHSSRAAVASATPPQLTYWSSATIDSAGRTGAPAVQFLGSSGTMTAGMPFALGSFVIVPAGDGSITRYDMTPVTISYQTQAINGVSTAGQDGTFAAPMQVHGWLEGTAGGGNPNTVSLSVDQGVQPADPRYYQPRLLPPLPASSEAAGAGGAGPLGTLTLNDRRSVLTLGAGSEPIELDAEINLTPSVPEPASFLIFLGGAAALLAFRRVRTTLPSAGRL